MEPIQQINRSLDAAKHTRWAVYGFIGLFIVSGMIFAYNRFWPQTVSTSPTIAEESPKVAGIEKKAIAIKKLIVYDRSDLLKKIPVPAEVAANKDNQFTSTAVIPKMPYGGTATGFVNLSSGISQTVVQANKRPLFGFGGKTGIGAIAGVSTRGNIAGVYANQDIVRIGGVNIGVAAAAGTIGNDFAAGGFLHIHSEF